MPALETSPSPISYHGSLISHLPSFFCHHLYSLAYSRFQPLAHSVASRVEISADEVSNQAIVILPTK